MEKLKKSISNGINIRLMLISAFLIFFSNILVIIRFYNRDIQFLYSFIDGYWVFTSSLFLASLIWYKPSKYFGIILLPFLLGFIDELLQYNNYFFHKFSINSSLWTRTFDINDLVAYCIGLIVVLITIMLLKFLEVKYNKNKIVAHD